MRLADQAQQRGRVGKDPDDVGATFDFFVQSLQRVGRPDLLPVRDREVRERGEVIGGLAEHRLDLGELPAEHRGNHVELVVGQLAPLFLDVALELLPVAFDAIPVHCAVLLGDGLMRPIDAADFVDVAEAGRGDEPVRAGRYGGLGLAAHLEASDAATTVVAMLEDAEALDHAEALAAVEGIDAFFLGRGDLTVALGETSTEAETVRRAVALLVAAVRAAGKPLCAFVGKTSEIPTLRALGVTAFMNARCRRCGVTPSIRSGISSAKRSSAPAARGKERSASSANWANTPEIGRAHV